MGGGGGVCFKLGVTCGHTLPDVTSWRLMQGVLAHIVISRQLTIPWSSILADNDHDDQRAAFAGRHLYRMG